MGQKVTSTGPATHASLLWIVAAADSLEKQTAPWRICLCEMCRRWVWAQRTERCVLSTHQRLWTPGSGHGKPSEEPVRGGAALSWNVLALIWHVMYFFWGEECFGICAPRARLSTPAA